MGDYRYFPEHPAPTRGSDAYGRPLMGERRPGATGQGQARAPQAQPPLTRGAGAYAPDPYAPPAYAADPYAPDPYASDAYAGDPYAPDPYAPDAYASGPYASGPYPAAYQDHDDDQPYLPRTPQTAHSPYAAPPQGRGGQYPSSGYAPQAHPRAPGPALTAHAAYDHGYTQPASAPAWVSPRGSAQRANAQAAPQMTTAMPPIRPAALMHGLGAVLSLGLVVLAGAWTWGMMQRDVSGVPVVRALEGPMRVAPETPGGQQASFQGLAVNELAGAGVAAETDVIVLAPEPMGLGDMAAISTPLTPPLLVPATDGAQIAAPALGFVNPTARAVATSPRPRPRGNAGTQMAVAPAPQISVPMPALSTSNDPRAADALAASIAQSVAQDLFGPRGIDVDPASIGPGTRLVQLGAYDNADEARKAWDGLSARFSPLLNDRGRVIEAAHSGGSVFYRLRAHGFTDERDARRFCAALVAEQIDCIPVLVR